MERGSRTGFGVEGVRRGGRRVCDVEARRGGRKATRYFETLGQEECDALEAEFEEVGVLVEEQYVALTRLRPEVDRVDARSLELYERRLPYLIRWTVRDYLKEIFFSLDWMVALVGLLRERYGYAGPGRTERAESWRELEETVEQLREELSVWKLLAQWTLEDEKNGNRVLQNLPNGLLEGMKSEEGWGCLEILNTLEGLGERVSREGLLWLKERFEGWSAWARKGWIAQESMGRGWVNKGEKFVAALESVASRQKVFGWVLKTETGEASKYDMWPERGRCGKEIESKKDEEETLRKREERLRKEEESLFERCKILKRVSMREKRRAKKKQRKNTSERWKNTSERCKSTGERRNSTDGKTECCWDC